MLRVSFRSCRKQRVPVSSSGPCSLNGLSTLRRTAQSGISSVGFSKGGWTPSACFPPAPRACCRLRSSLFRSTADYSFWRCVSEVLLVVSSSQKFGDSPLFQSSVFFFALDPVFPPRWTNAPARDPRAPLFSRCSITDAATTP